MKLLEDMEVVSIVIGSRPSLVRLKDSNKIKVELDEDRIILIPPSE